MESGKLLKVFSVLMLLVCAFGIVAGIWGFFDAVNTKKAKEAVRAQTEAQISQIEKETAALDAKSADYETNAAALKRNKATYESNKAAYDMLKTAYDAKAAEFKAVKEAGYLDNAAISETQSILDAGTAKLEAGKAKLAEYEAEQTFVDNYKAEQAALDTGLSELSINKAVTVKINSGMTPMAAVKEVFYENNAKDSRQFSAGIYLCAVSLVIAVLAFFASIKGMAALKSSDNDKIKDGVFLGFIGLILAVAANVFESMSGYNGNILLATALSAEAVFVLLFVIAILKYRNAITSHSKSY